jgi:hypothetical protein
MPTSSARAHARRIRLEIVVGSPTRQCRRHDAQHREGGAARANGKGGGRSRKVATR